MKYHFETNPNGDKVVMAEFGYAVIKPEAVYIPAVMGKLHPVLEFLYDLTNQKRIIFTAVMNPNEFKKHLRNIKGEWDEWFPEMGCYSHFIEIQYEPTKPKSGKIRSGG